MGAQEIATLGVCADSSARADELIATLREGGRWGLLPVVAGEVADLDAVFASVQLLLLHAGPSQAGGVGSGGSGDGLVAGVRLRTQLAARPRTLPLVVIGGAPTSALDPTVWLPELPAPAVLARLIGPLLERGEPASGVAGSWRRKSDVIIGDSPPIRQLLSSLDRLAPAQTPVLITGESGVGKELVARSLHFCGPRAGHPFVVLNCAALPETLIEAELFGYQRGAFTGAVSSHVGAFEAADQGTLFLDEIGEMPLTMQSKLLRVLESSEVQRIGSTERRPVNFRLITATNRNLELEVQEGRFRLDLYYRIQVYPLHVAPLRERIEDIPRLVTHHLSAIAVRERRPVPRLSPAALDRLLSYPWPGNIRELVNLLERASLLAENHVIEADHVVLAGAGPLGATGVQASVAGPAPVAAQGGAARPARATGAPGAASAAGNGATDEVLLPYRDAKARFEADYYRRLLRAAGGNVALAARMGQKTRKEVYDAVKRCGLDLAELDGAEADGAPRRRRRTSRRA